MLLQVAYVVIACITSACLVHSRSRVPHEERQRNSRLTRTWMDADD